MDPSPQYDLAPAPYGHACMNCSQSKCKCILPKGGGRCQRCQRLNKECRPSAFHRRQTSRRSSKTGRLEKKLDDLVTLLRAKEQSADGPVGKYAGLIEELRGAPETQTQTQTQTQAQSHARISRTVSPVERTMGVGYMTPATGNSQDRHGLGRSSVDPTPAQAEEYLDVFATQKLPYFPLLCFPPNTTAQQLQNERPFLWLCIMAVVSKSSRQRSALCDKVRDTVAQRMVHEFVGRDLDFLLGLLVFMAWSNQQVFRKLNMSVFGEFAKTVVFELTLNKPPLSDGALLICNLQPTPEEVPPAPPVRTMEERRAVLACFLLTSMVSLFLQKIDPLRWTPHMDECLHVLSEHPECLNDEVLIHQVRLQLINEKIHLSDWHGGLAATHEPLKAPTSLYLHAMESQLGAAQNKLSLHSQRYKIIHLHHLNTALTLHESSLLPQTASLPFHPPNLNFQALENLHASLNAVKAWLATFLALPPSEYTNFPFSIFVHLARNLAALYRLSTLDDPAWDKAYVRREVDIMWAMDRLIGNLGLAAEEARSVGGEDVVFYSIEKYDSLRRAWGGEVGVGGGSGVAVNTATTAAATAATATATATATSTGCGVGDGPRMGLMEAEVQPEIQDLGSVGLGTGFDDWFSDFLNSMVQ
ncbi:hypothetical protein BO70DRAFT_299324 [Aspergillus heteromorphus CBS 117.55]|uniref:Zn(2)-C6 fungal-type domain-containing protein n=1 Tax=Aspergillus heteromorphus CBS 117.55 TaxID=1448321 RepID=A0A317VAF1_9EURO|nr:uncharacterized protein BO70DRAFT_299324 [Aspergillus heteromorphus CBS 117.55]PWY70281.1 hypothetical protein BO70DRAFT_299324 [Aspergillus heteromorphus CBS 117.55]